MGFAVAADAYGRFMGRYAEPLAAEFLRFAGVEAGQRALDVGCGPGALTSLLVDRLGVSRVSAVDPSPPFVAAVAARCHGVDAHRGVAEQLPFPDGRFDAALAQLVVHFMRDPVAGLREMGRVVRPAGTVAACVWDLAGGTSPLSPFWSAVRELDPEADDESELPGTREGHLGELCRAAGLLVEEETSLTVSVAYETFQEWWEPYTLGVGPAGDYVAGLRPAARERLRARCAEALGPGPFEVTATAWAVRAVKAR